MKQLIVFITLVFLFSCNAKKKATERIKEKTQIEEITQKQSSQTTEMTKTDKVNEIKKESVRSDEIGFSGIPNGFEASVTLSEDGLTTIYKGWANVSTGKRSTTTDKKDSITIDKSEYVKDLVDISEQSRKEIHEEKKGRNSNVEKSGFEIPWYAWVLSIVVIGVILTIYLSRKK